MNKRFGIDFFLTKTCNKTCYYCTSHTKEQRNLIVDMEFLKFVMNEFSKYGSEHFAIRLLGGETALIENLKEIVDYIKTCNVKRIEVYSNSLVRERYPWILTDPNIMYNEHMFYRVKNNKIEKLGDYDFLPENNLDNHNIVVLTNNFIDNYKNEDLTSLLHKNTTWKMVNNRSNVDTIDGYESRYQEFTEFIENKGLRVSSDLWNKDSLTEENRKLCSINPPSPVINFEDKTIHHCSKVPDLVNKKECNEENIKRLVKSYLFMDFPEYCQKCIEPALHHRIEYRQKCNAGIPTN